MRPAGETALQPSDGQRRRFLEAGVGAALMAASPCVLSTPPLPSSSEAARSSHFPFGPVVPQRPIPAWPVVTHQSRKTDLAALLRGHTSAVQLMFTGCSATCPIQGALFAETQHELLNEPADTQLVSLSIDPLADTPAALSAWLRSFSAAPGWLGVTPRPDDLDRIFDLLGNGGERRPTGADRHTGQVYIINRRGELTYRTPSLPSTEHIVSVIRLVAARP